MQKKPIKKQRKVKKYAWTQYKNLSKEQKKLNAEDILEKIFQKMRKYSKERKTLLS